MQQFDRDAAAFNRLCVEGNIEQAIELGLTTCYHGREKNDEPEEACLRDARTDLLTRSALLAQTTTLDEEADARLHALLERRVFNWLCDGEPLEAFLFAQLMPYGDAVFDTGFDRQAPLTLDEFMGCVAGRCAPGAQRSLTQERLDWLGAMADAVGREIWNRAQAILDNEPLRVGSRVVASGLRTERYNNLRGTLLKRQGQRWGVIFDGAREPKALRPENLDVALPPAWRFLPFPTPPIGKEYVRRNGLTRAPERCEICPGVVNFGEFDDAASEPKRVESYRRYLLRGECAHCLWRPVES